MDRIDRSVWGGLREHQGKKKKLCKRVYLTYENQFFSLPICDRDLDNHQWRFPDRWEWREESMRSIFFGL
jgi:hypothetical protein